MGPAVRGRQGRATLPLCLLRPLLSPGAHISLRGARRGSSSLGPFLPVFTVAGRCCQEGACEAPPVTVTPSNRTTCSWQRRLPETEPPAVLRTQRCYTAPPPKEAPPTGRAHAVLGRGQGGGEQTPTAVPSGPLHLARGGAVLAPLL